MVLLADELVATSVFASRYLGVRDYVNLSIVLRRPFKVRDVIVNCQPLPCGLARLDMWEKLFLLDADAGSFQPQHTLESRSSRKGNRADFQKLKFGLDSGPAVDTDLTYLSRNGRTSVTSTSNTQDEKKAQQQQKQKGSTNREDDDEEDAPKTGLSLVISDAEEDMKIEYDRCVLLIVVCVPVSLSLCILMSLAHTNIHSAPPSLP